MTSLLRGRTPRAALAAAAATCLVMCAAARAQEPPADFRAYTETLPGTSIAFDMVPIPGGEFQFGSPDAEAGRSDDEGPVRRVKIRPFWMGKCEVTWDEFDQFAFSLDIKRRAAIANADPIALERVKQADAVTRPTPPYADMTFGHGHDGQPAICMTHHAAMEYCRWLSAKTGKLYRLPTEAEWEFACRANTKTAYSFGDDPAQLGEHAWYVENAEKPMPVGKKKPNPFGLFDMHGNVAEWCLDHYVKDFHSRLSADAVVASPVNKPDAKEYPYVVRGGSWDDDAERLRSAARRGSDPEWSMQDPQRPQSIWWHTEATFAGFRVVRPVEEQEDLKGLRSPIVKGKGSRGN